MKWTEPTPPTEGISNYDHCICDTPLGIFKIEWKSWKKYDTYDISTEHEWFDFGNDLEEAKQKVLDYLTDKNKELTEYLKDT